MGPGAASTGPHRRFTNVDGDGRAAGFWFAAGSYFLWGFLPLYLVLLAPTGPLELLGLRIVLTVVVCAVLLLVTRGWAQIARLFAEKRTRWMTLLAALLIYVNWLVFMYAALSGHVLETSLGYFINPLATVVLAVLVLRERVRLIQWVAIGIGAVAVIVMVVGNGTFPWISLALAASFSLYGLVKNRLGKAVDAVSGLTIETIWLIPFAVIQLVFVATTSGITYLTSSTMHAVLVSLLGVTTAVPLLLFAAGARRISLTTIGLLQFIAPILQFICGAYVFGEPMPPARWAGFILVWIALVVLVSDVLWRARPAKRRQTTDPVALA